MRSHRRRPSRRCEDGGDGRWRATPSLRYEVERTSRGFTLTVQPEENADRKVLGKGLSLYTLALEERTHRGWPHEATDIIMAFTEAELARRIVPAYREGP